MAFKKWGALYPLPTIVTMIQLPKTRMLWLFDPKSCKTFIIRLGMWTINVWKSITFTNVERFLKCQHSIQVFIFSTRMNYFSTVILAHIITTPAIISYYRFIMRILIRMQLLVRIYWSKNKPLRGLRCVCQSKQTSYPNLNMLEYQASSSDYFKIFNAVDFIDWC